MSMSQAEQRLVKVLVLPVFRRTWLFHAWSEPGPQPPKDLQWKGSSLQEKWALTLQNWQHRFDTTVSTQWRELKVAPSGSFRSYLYKLAQFVLSREDPVESFLKAVPKQARQLEIIYPESFSETLVRRRLRSLVLGRIDLHRRKTFGWGLVTLPQLPLILTPVPNVTVYFSLYRYLSHLQAMNGASLFKSAFDRSDMQQLQHMYRMLQSPKPAADPALEISTWRSRRLERSLARKEDKCSKLLKKSDASGKVPALVFQANSFLDQMTSPADRWNSPLSDAAVQKISEHFQLHDLVEHFVRARNRVTSQDQAPGQGQTYFKLTAEHYRNRSKNKRQGDKGKATDACTHS